MSKRMLLAAAWSVILSGCSVFQPSPPPPPPSATPSPPPPPQVRRAEPPRVEPPRAEPPRVEAPLPQARLDSPPRKGGTDINESEQVSLLIKQAQNVAAMSPEEQRRELSSANRAIAREPSIASYLKLALLLSLPGTAIDDEGRALSLLEPLIGGGSTAGPLQRFAALLHGQLAERVREQKRSAQMREQLDALKAMERSLMRRSQGRSR